LTYLDMILSDNYTSAHRAGCFFIGLGFSYSSLFSAVFENLLPCGNDVAALLPRFLTIKRGFWVCVSK
jgi:NCS1 family nucleobase:cation symporter-1